MKTLRKKLWAKLLAAVLLFVFLTAALAAAVLTLVLARYGVYSGGGMDAYCESYVSERADEITGRVLSLEATDRGIYLNDELAEEFDGQEPSNFAFTVSSATGTEIYTYGSTDHLLYAKTWSIERTSNSQHLTRTTKYASEEALDRAIAAMEANGNHIVIYTWDPDTKLATIKYQRSMVVDVLKVTGGLDAAFPESDNVYYVYHVLKFGTPLRVALPIFAAAGLLCAITLAIFLCSGAGRRTGDDELHETFLDRMPLGCYFLLTALLALIPRWLLRMAQSHDTCHPVWAIAALILALLVSVVLLLGLLLTLCIRLKQRGWWRNTLIYRVLRPACKRLWHGLCALWRYLPLYWKSGIVWLVLCLIEGVAFAERIPLLWIAEKILLTPALIACVIFLRRLQKGAERIGSGDLDYQIDVSHMPHLMRRHGEQLNHISDGLQHAVEEQMRSERMKAELITNVSHDIKTPLTSIVSYVDLLKKDGLQSEKAPEYLEVLDRQSARLKKLTEDLIDASKASTGNVKVQLESADLNVVLSQALGDYESRLEQAKLEPVVKLTDAPAEVWADGKLLWRVFDNLLGNICKYALPNTRVYFRTGVDGAAAFAEFKNISAQALDIAPEELMERFVRGDASRSTEGSGLGLSIAQSLMELQGGELRLTVDGDLFKATVKLQLDTSSEK